MAGSIERREYDRERRTNKVRYSFLGSEEYHDAQLIDRGSGGLCMATSFPLKTGVMIYGQILDLYPACEGLEAHRSFQGKVRWSRDLGDHERTRYGIGIQYTRSVCY